MTNRKGLALVTGASKRIGRALVLALADDGYDVAIHYDRSKSDAEHTAERASKSGVTAKTFQADLLCREDIASLVPNVCDQFRTPLNVLINNASIFEYDNVTTATAESWDRHLKSNLEAPVFLTQSFATQFDANVHETAGVVINMVDQRVRKLTPEFLTYSLAKSGLWTFTQTAAQALAPNIRVNGIAPGPTIRGARQSMEHFEKQRSATLLGKGSSAAGIVEAMRFLLAAQEFTGQLLCVDGGQHLAWRTPDVIGEI